MGEACIGGGFDFVPRDCLRVIAQGYLCPLSTPRCRPDGAPVVLSVRRICVEMMPFTN